MKNKGKGIDIPPKDRFSALYLAYKANDMKTAMEDVFHFVKKTNI